MLETRPHKVILVREDLVFSIGYESDLSWADVKSLHQWVKKWNAFYPRNKVQRISLEMLKAIIGVKKISPGALVDGSPGPSKIQFGDRVAADPRA